ncbi:ABC transporter, ATP-binding protein [Pelomyxa schiedti]|nr:ABC transporter, ATP-binding protein [Pelomyxa schiedti]
MSSSSPLPRVTRPVISNSAPMSSSSSSSSTSTSQPSSPTSLRSSNSNMTSFGSSSASPTGSRSNSGPLKPLSSLSSSSSNSWSSLQGGSPTNPMRDSNSQFQMSFSTAVALIQSQEKRPAPSKLKSLSQDAHALSRRGNSPPPIPLSCDSPTPPPPPLPQSDSSSSLSETPTSPPMITLSEESRPSRDGSRSPSPPSHSSHHHHHHRHRDDGSTVSPPCTSPRHSSPSPAHRTGSQTKPPVLPISRRPKVEDPPRKRGHSQSSPVPPTEATLSSVIGKIAASQHPLPPPAPSTDVSPPPTEYLDSSGSDNAPADEATSTQKSPSPHLPRPYRNHHAKKKSYHSLPRSASRNEIGTPTSPGLPANNSPPLMETTPEEVDEEVASLTSQSPHPDDAKEHSSTPPEITLRSPDTPVSSALKLPPLDGVSRLHLSRHASMTFLLKTAAPDLQPRNAIVDSFCQKDSEFLLCCKNEPVPVRITVKSDGTALIISFNPAAKGPGIHGTLLNFPRELPLDTIEVCIGQTNSSFKQCKLHDRVDCSFTIWSKGTSYNLVARSKVIQQDWVSSLGMILQIPHNPLDDATSEFVNRAWHNVNTKGNPVNFEETRKLLSFMNFAPPKKQLLSEFVEVAGSETAQLSLEKFRVLVYTLICRGEIESLFTKFAKAKGRAMTVNDLLAFHRTAQQEGNFNKSDAYALLRKFGSRVEDSAAAVTAVSPPVTGPQPSAPLPILHPLSSSHAVPPLTALPLPPLSPRHSTSAPSSPRNSQGFIHKLQASIFSTPHQPPPELPATAPEPTQVITQQPESQGPSQSQPGIEFELLQHGFESYLLSRNNSLFRPNMAIIHQDMTAPIQHYTISSSPANLPSTDSYLLLFRDPCIRYLEVKCLDGGEEPATSFGPLRTLMCLIKEHAFVSNMYPMILYLNVKKIATKPLVQKQVADILVGILNSSLATPCVQDIRFLPSPENLKNKFLLMSEMKFVSEELAHILFLHAYNFDDFCATHGKRKVWDVLSVSETMFAKIDPAFVEECARKILVRVYPSNSKTIKFSHKQNPCIYWASGVQIVVPSVFNEVFEGKFSDNGLCGYNRKPWFITQDPIQFDDLVQFTDHSQLNTITQITIEVLSARALPITKRSHTTDPHVELEIFGVPADCALKKTKSVKNNGFNPTWANIEEPFKFPLTMSQHAILQLRIMDGETLVAHATLPVHCIRAGYRIVHLKSPTGNTKLSPICTLFVKATLSPNITAKYPFCDQLRAIPMRAVVLHPEPRMLCRLANPPNDSDPPMQTFEDVVCACTISTYPFDQETKSQMGTPICDQYNVTVYNDHVAFSLADGCNWGRAPRMAANKSTAAFINYVEQRIISSYRRLHTLKELATLMFEALCCANRSISSGMTFSQDTGTTTFLGGVLFKLASNDTNLFITDTEDTWTCICISVGDCKAFLWNLSTGLSNLSTASLTEVCGTRCGTDPSDPGGRLGPYLNGLRPDTRNLTLTHFDLQPGDYLIIVSDGVHDNLDAPSLGKTPGAVSAELSSYSTWADAYKANPTLTEKIKSDFMCEHLKQELLKNCGEGLPTPGKVVDGIMKYCVSTTGPSREFMEQNPHKKLVCDYTLYPGKLDHTSCLCICVGRGAECCSSGTL